MEIISSYGAEIRKLKKPLCATLDIYQKAVAWLVPVYDREWETLELQTDKNRQFNLAEHLVHETKKNRAIYPFDDEFPKMPSYLRRSAIRHPPCAGNSLLLQEQEGNVGTGKTVREAAACCRKS